MKTKVLAVVRAHPGLTAFQIQSELRARSWAGRLFGAGSMLAALFGPGSNGVYLALAELEQAKLIRSETSAVTKEHHTWRQVWLPPKGRGTAREG
jgi:hypothetical protein